MLVKWDPGKDGKGDTWDHSGVTTTCVNKYIKRTDSGGVHLDGRREYILSTPFRQRANLRDTTACLEYQFRQLANGNSCDFWKIIKKKIIV